MPSKPVSDTFGSSITKAKNAMIRNWIYFVLFCCVGMQVSLADAGITAKGNGLITLSPNHEPKEPTRKKAFSSNPLTVNGLSLDYTLFSIYSRGKLAVVEGNPEAPNATRIPFRVYLKRSGVIIRPEKPQLCQDMTEVDLKDVLTRARVGDELVIEPIRKEDAMARRTIRLRDFWFPMIMIVPRGAGDGC